MLPPPLQHLSAEDLTALLDAIGEGVVIHAPGGEAIAWNRTALTLLDLAPEQLQGRRPTDPLWGVEREDGEPLSLDLLPASVARTTGRDVHDVRFWLRVHDGPRRLIFGSARPIRHSSAPGPYMVVSTFRDITESHEREATDRRLSAERAEREITRVVMQHDAVLADLTRVLVSTLDEEVLLTRAIATLAPSLAPYAASVQSDWQGTPRRVAESGDPALRSSLGALIQQSAPISDAHPLTLARWMGRPQFVAIHTADDASRLLGASAHQMALLEPLLPMHVVAAPLTLHGEHHAVLLLAFIDQDQSRRPPDAVLLEDIISRLELALSNVRSFSDAQRELRDRRKADAALRASEMRYRAVAMLVSDAILDADLRTFRVHCSGGAADLLGAVGDVPDGRLLFQQLVHPDDEARVTSQFRTAMASADVTCALEFRIVTSSQAVHTVTVDGRILRDARGSATRCVMALRDVTSERSRQRALVEETTALATLVDERTRQVRQANDAMREAMRHKDHFLSSMSHELRTPLNTMLGFSDCMLDGLYGDLTDAQRLRLEEIRGSGRHLLSLINDVLDLGRIEAGEFKPVLATIDVPLLANMVVRRIRPLAQRKQIGLRLVVGDDVPTLVSDERALTQILVNLLDNAVKFTDSGGEVSLTIRPYDVHGAIGFQVTDTGIGIAAEDFAHLFRPFKQIDGSLHRRHQGTGLGLAHADRMAKALGGSIEVWSERAIGSRFTLVLTPHVANQR